MVRRPRLSGRGNPADNETLETNETNETREVDMQLPAAFFWCALPALGESTDTVRWTPQTLPAIAVHVADPQGLPVSDLTVSFDGGGERLELQTDAAGAAVQRFARPTHWLVTVYADQQAIHQLWVDLPPRQRADVHLRLGGPSTAQGTTHRPPVVEPDTAARGAVHRLGALRRRP